MDGFFIVDVKEATVTRYVAKSPSMKAMDKQEFQQSKVAVLDFLDDLIGCRPQEGIARRCPWEFASTSWGKKVWAKHSRKYLEKFGPPPLKAKASTTTIPT